MDLVYLEWVKNFPSQVNIGECYSDICITWEIVGVTSYTVNVSTLPLSGESSILYVPVLLAAIDALQ